LKRKVKKMRERAGKSPSSPNTHRKGKKEAGVVFSYPPFHQSPEKRIIRKEPVLPISTRKKRSLRGGKSRMVVMSGGLVLGRKGLKKRGKRRGGRRHFLPFYSRL